MGGLANFEIKSALNDYKDMLFKSKKYWLIYLVLILVLGISTMHRYDILNQHFIILTFVVVAILGVFSIVFYFLHDSDEEFYKVAFVIILMFGITTALILPICDVSDEIEHLARAEITSKGVIIPHWTGEDMGVERLYNYTDNETISSEKNIGAGFHSIQSYNFFSHSLGKTVFQTNHDTDKINNRVLIIESAFEQNPFFGYLPQAIGVFFAKFLDLSVIWILWLARICNLIFYAGVVSFAVKKTPALKLPLLAVACIPISMYQASSASIDCMIIALAILSISYFIYMCRAEDNSLTVKNIAVFSTICLLLGLCKLPYLAFVILLLFIPSKKFVKDKKHNLPILLLFIAIVAVIGVLWSRYSAPTLLHSWRSSHNLINSTLQFNYVTHHPESISRFIYNIIFLEIPNMAAGVFSFFGANQYHHYTDKYYLVTPVLLIYLALVLFTYPRNVKFKLKTRLGSLFTIIVIYVGICFIQLLTWASVGYYNLGISTRYFIPLFCLFPIVLWIRNIKFDAEKFDRYAMVFMIAFMATLIISIATKYYWAV